MSFVIETQNLCRSYKTYEKSQGLKESLKGFWNRKYQERHALKPTTLQIEGEQIVGLVGANGAGKTTLLKLLSGLIHPSSGSARVLGFEPHRREYEYLRQMSILLGQKNQLWWDIPPVDSYALLSKIYDLDDKDSRHRVLELAEMLDCRHVLNIQLRRLSLGERMKMEIIGALLHKPKILFLDEPTIGLDIVAQTKIRVFLESYVKEQGPTVILTSHYMDDIAKLADRLLLISKGSLMYDGTVEDFVEKSEAKQQVSFSLSQGFEKELIFLDQYKILPGNLHITWSVNHSELSSLLSKIAQLEGISDLRIEAADFEDTIHDFLEKESRVL